ncbi:Lipoyltransferase and lipoate-protein ligase [Serendipita vermifera]|nr:Lipoyltransferase and lipoate-protein ligase [Serendipita vermifera]
MPLVLSLHHGFRPTIEKSKSLSVITELTLTRHRTIRYFSSKPPLTITTSPIYISTSTSPLWNLSLEDLLFRRAPAESPLLLIYRNDPCVVIGRNQNPWKEMNMAALQAAGLPFVRRRSGGGTVYHDLGNTNFSLHLPRNSFERKKGSALALEALKKLKVPDAWVNDRNDVCVSEYKVSGSAYKIINDRAYHHGTMLLNAEVGQLRDVLRNTKDGMVGRSVTSVRSPVKNIAEMKPGVEHNVFSEALIDSFCSQFSMERAVTLIGEEIMDADHPEEKRYIEHSITELESWEWKYGQTLDFTHRISGKVEGHELDAEINAKHGIITSCRIEPREPDLTSAIADAAQVTATYLVGKRYASTEYGGFEGGLLERQLLRWLQSEM